MLQVYIGPESVSKFLVKLYELLEQAVQHAK